MLQFSSNFSLLSTEYRAAIKQQFHINNQNFKQRQSHKWTITALIGSNKFQAFWTLTESFHAFLLRWLSFKNKVINSFTLSAPADPPFTADVSFSDFEAEALTSWASVGPAAGLSTASSFLRLDITLMRFLKSSRAVVAEIQPWDGAKKTSIQKLCECHEKQLWQPKRDKPLLDLISYFICQGGSLTFTSRPGKGEIMTGAPQFSAYFNLLEVRQRQSWKNRCSLSLRARCLGWCSELMVMPSRKPPRRVSAFSWS